MDLYLMRHGQAGDAADDRQRALTERGRADVARVAAQAARAGLRVDRIYHSGLLRAQQSAEILAGHLGAADRVEARAGLTPMDPVEPLVSWLLDEARARPNGAIALVGHLPLLDHLVARLVAGDEAEQLVAFDAGTLLKLVPRPAGQGFAIAWMLTPALLPPA